jgi:hypothetical protein
MDGLFEGLGWKVKLQQKRQQYLLTLAKEVALGSGLKRGDDLFYYLVECNNRKGLLVFLDGQERLKDEFVRLRGISFIVRK